jgi:uncharacterized protein YeaO (DUF488 family)
MSGVIAAPAVTRIFVYERDRQPVLKEVRSVASEEGYYKIERKDSTVPSNTIDRIYIIIEGKAGPIIQRLVTARDFVLSDKSKGILSNFIAFLAFRTPWARETAKSIDLTTKKQDFKKFAENKERFNEFAKKFDPTLDSEQIEQTRQGMLNLDDHVDLRHKETGENESYFMAFGVAVAWRCIPTLFRKQWTLVESIGSERFITSDNPVVRVPPANFRQGMRVGFDNCPVFFPISPKRALLLDNHKHSNQVVRVGDTQVIEFNGHVISNAHQFVFASTSSTRIQTIFDQTEKVIDGSIYLS